MTKYIGMSTTRDTQVCDVSISQTRLAGGGVIGGGGGGGPMRNGEIMHVTVRRWAEGGCAFLFKNRNIADMPML
jgi:hypothetical protein